MSANKYPCTFSRQMEAIVYVSNNKKTTKANKQKKHILQVILLLTNLYCPSFSSHYLNNSLHLARKNAYIFLSADVICSRIEQFSESVALILEERKMSNEKYLSIFAPSRGYRVDDSSNVYTFFPTRADVKIGEYHSDILQC